MDGRVISLEIFRFDLVQRWSILQGFNLNIVDISVWNKKGRIRMTEERDSKPSLEQEFEKLGQNIREALQGAWGSDERKRLSEEIQRGLNEVGEALGKVANDLQQNETVQHVSTEVDEFAERIQTGEFAKKIRAETSEALESLNRELENWLQRWTEEGNDDEAES